MHGLSVAVSLEERADLPSAEQRILVVHVVRELLFNVVKHARVKKATLSVGVVGTDLEVRVEDEGVGFEVEHLRRGSAFHSLGLFGVEERLRLFGGSVDIRAAAGRGTRVRILLPMVYLDASAGDDPSPDR
jgi:signal transduction histidine kinase